jgi:hypothetical protein
MMTKLGFRRLKFVVPTQYCDTGTESTPLVSGAWLICLAKIFAESL